MHVFHLHVSYMVVASQYYAPYLIFKFGSSYNKNHHKLAICIGNHTHSSPIWEVGLIVLAIVKIGRGEAKSDFYYCVYNYSLIGQECV